jgi:hypothetical protein
VPLQLLHVQYPVSTRNHNIQFSHHLLRASASAIVVGRPPITATLLKIWSDSNNKLEII